MFESFDERATRAMVQAQEEARGLNHDHLGTEHILLGLVAEEDGAASKILTTLGVSVTNARQKVEQLTGRGEHPVTGHIEMTEEAVARIEDLEANANGEIGTQDVLRALIDDHSTSAAQILGLLDVGTGAVEEAIDSLAGGADPGGQGADTASETQNDSPPGALKGQIGDILLAEGLITAEQLEEALAEHSKTGKLLGRVLVDMDMITETDLLRALSQQIGLEFVDLSKYEGDPLARSLLPESVAQRYRVIPLGEREGKLLLAMSDPADRFAIEDVQKMTGREVQPVVASAMDIDHALMNYRAAADQAVAPKGEWTGPPLCPRCGGVLDAVSSTVFELEGGSSAAIVSCPSCGASLGVLPG
ncbi:MAG: Clp protease N-terminal domain-containing protein [Actinomycetota bacterium]